MTSYLFDIKPSLISSFLSSSSTSLLSTSLVSNLPVADNCRSWDASINASLCAAASRLGQPHEFELHTTSESLPASLLGTSNTTQDIDSVTTVLMLCVFGWVSYALIVRNFVGSKKPTSYAARIVSMTHGSLATIYCARNVWLRYQYGSHQQDTAAFFSNIVCVPELPFADEQFAACLIAGYFLYDSVGMLLGGYYEPLYMCHHLFAIALMFTSIFGQKLGQEVAVGIALFECTAPLLNFRWLLQFHKYNERYADGWLWWFCDTFYLAFFFAARIVCAGGCVISYYSCEGGMLHISVLLTLLVFGSGMFLVDSAKKLMRGEHWVH